MILVKMGETYKHRLRIPRFCGQLCCCGLLLFVAVILGFGTERCAKEQTKSGLCAIFFVEGFSPKVIRRNHRYRRISSPSRIGESFETALNDVKDCSIETVDHHVENYTKSHSLSVCLVPPSPGSPLPSLIPHNATTVSAAMKYYLGSNDNDDESSDLWRAVTAMRVELKDPGLYRWPPHVNLLYPFVRYHEEHGGSAANETGLLAILTKLRSAARAIQPFWVVIDLTNDNSSPDSGFGKFGNSNRGVLWVYPQSLRGKGSNHDNSHANNTGEIQMEPIAELYSKLEDEFPMCGESLKNREFIPHMTLSSKFGSLQDAVEAEARLTECFLSSDKNGRFDQSHLCYWCQEFYLLERDSPDGQFRRRATIALGRKATSSAKEKSSRGIPLDGIWVHDPPLAFGGMPTFEEDWIAEELHSLQERRKENRKNRPRGTKPRKSYRARKRERRQAELAIASMKEKVVKE